MKFYLLLLSFYFSSFNIVNAQRIIPQPEMQAITFQELISNLTTGSDSVYELKNALISFNDSMDTSYLTNQYRRFNKAYPKKQVHIYKKVIFNNVQFINAKNYDYYAIVNWHFHKKVQLSNVRDISFYNSIFDNEFSIKNTTLISDENRSHLILKDDIFNGKFSVIFYSESVNLGVIIENNTFNETNNSEIGNSVKKPNFLLDAYKFSFLNFRLNKINYDRASFLFQLSNIEDIYFEKNEIKSDRWNYMLFSEINNFIFLQNNIEADLLFDLDKLESKYNFQWPLSSKNILPLNYFFEVSNSSEASDEQFDKWSNSNRGADQLLYRNGLTQLSKFHTYFQNFNDRQSANDVYVKIKDLETGRLESLYVENPTFENFFELLVIRFLKRFSNYGTSPSKIVISAFQIILLFAFLFLFSSNSWNSVNFKILNDKIKPSISYFVTNNTIENSFRTYKIGQHEYAESQKLLIENKSNIPAVFYLPSITFVKAQHKIAAVKLKIWKYFNVVEGSWVDLPKRKKITNSILLSAFLFFFIAFKILTLLLNALTLSINSFTTLGFGEIPIKGLGRYLAIIEGFIGWIFLTLFSVTLISQVLS